MGVFLNISKATRLLALTAAVIGLWTVGPGTPQASADPPPARERPVSSRPDRGDARGGSDASQGRTETTPSRPLTRAAARQRIEEMSPLDWLSRYGEVTVGRSR